MLMCLRGRYDPPLLFAGLEVPLAGGLHHSTRLRRCRHLVAVLAELVLGAADEKRFYGRRCVRWVAATWW
jgi:hypothetical protein